VKLDPLRPDVGDSASTGSKVSGGLVVGVDDGVLLADVVSVGVVDALMVGVAEVVGWCRFGVGLIVTPLDGTGSGGAVCDPVVRVSGEP
jgi:hypothetical protein